MVVAVPTTSHILDALDDEQRLVATTFDSPVAVIAGAGVLGYELGVQVIANELGKNIES